MKRIGILSDTHGCWDDRYETYFKDCDEVWHAGDIGDYSIVERLATPRRVVRAVRGNVDHGEVARKCSELEIFEVENVKVLLTHIGGYPPKWSPGMKTLIRDNGINIVVDGHSHILRIMHDPISDTLLVNPGAAGRQGWQKMRTLVRLKLDCGDIRDCEVIELS